LFSSAKVRTEDGSGGDARQPVFAGELLDDRPTRGNMSSGTVDWKFSIGG
jgi:hypothetical protein